MGKQRNADLLLELAAARLQAVALGFRHAAHLGVGCGIRDQRFGVGKLLHRRAIGLHGVDQRIELGQLAGDLHIFVGRELAENLRFEGSVMGKEYVQFGFG